MIRKTPKPTASRPQPPESFRELVATIRMPSEDELRNIEQIAADCATLLEKAEARGR